MHEWSIPVHSWYTTGLGTISILSVNGCINLTLCKSRCPGDQPISSVLTLHSSCYFVLILSHGSYWIVDNSSACPGRMSHSPSHCCSSLRPIFLGRYRFYIYRDPLWPTSSNIPDCLLHYPSVNTPELTFPSLIHSIHLSSSLALHYIRVGRSLGDVWL